MKPSRHHWILLSLSAACTFYTEGNGTTSATDSTTTTTGADSTTTNLPDTVGTTTTTTTTSSTTDVTTSSTTGTSSSSTTSWTSTSSSTSTSTFDTTTEATVSTGETTTEGATTVAGFCGDGVLDPGEECDDGNAVNGDGCTAMCTSEAPEKCQEGVDPGTMAPWVVCDADANSAWLSANSEGHYHPVLICTNLGYTDVGQWGGTCGAVCGFCGREEFSCDNTGKKQFNYGDWGGVGNCGNDGLGPLICNSVHWTCVK